MKKYILIITLLLTSLVSAQSQEDITRIQEYKERVEDIYKCNFEIPNKEQCQDFEALQQGEKTWKEIYIVEYWNKMYEEYRDWLETIYYDNNCTWQDFIFLVHSEQKETPKCEQRESIEGIGLEKERPSKINQYLTCVDLVTESIKKICPLFLIGDASNIIEGEDQVFERADIDADQVKKHAIALTKITYKEKVRRREVTANLEELYHRSDQLWQKLNLLEYRYMREIFQFEKELNCFIRCVERAQAFWNWLENKV